jgi:hypothetical protein
MGIYNNSILLRLKEYTMAKTGKSTVTPNPTKGAHGKPGKNIPAKTTSTNTGKKTSRSRQKK